MWMGFSVMIAMGLGAVFFLFSLIMSAVSGGASSAFNMFTPAGASATDPAVASSGMRTGGCCIPCIFPIPLLFLGGGLPFLRNMRGEGTGTNWMPIILAVVAGLVIMGLIFMVMNTLMATLPFGQM